jgi:hypothetical protein
MYLQVIIFLSYVSISLRVAQEHLYRVRAKHTVDDRQPMSHPEAASAITAPNDSFSIYRSSQDLPTNKP